MSYLSPVDAAQVYFEPLDVEEDERPRCEPDDDRGRDRYDGYRPDDMRADQRERFDRLEDARERFERSRDPYEDDRPAPHPHPRL